jgi:Domain of unknown function (DUF6089)
VVKKVGTKYNKPFSFTLKISVNKKGIFVENFDLYKIMKKHTQLLVLLLIVALSSQSTMAQFKFSNLFGSKEKARKNHLFEPNSTVSLGFGSSSYYGDLSPYGRIIQSTINGVRWNANFNFTRHISPTLAVRFGLTWARISGDDSFMSGVTGYEANFMRNLHFRNDIKELSIVAQYDLVRTEKSFLRREKIIPYIFGGIAVFAHDPVARADSNLFANNAWTRLQPLNTEGQGLPGYATPYSLISVSFPIGFGVRYKLNQSFDLGFEAGFRYTLTDYLDDAGGNYADPVDLAGQSPLSASFGNRTLENFAANRGIDRRPGVITYLINQGDLPASTPLNTDLPGIVSSVQGFSDKTDQRGNPKFNDSYMLTTIKLIYHIPGKIRCPVTR